jgi:hypothetical protein
MRLWSPFVVKEQNISLHALGVEDASRQPQYSMQVCDLHQALPDRLPAPLEGIVESFCRIYELAADPQQKHKYDKAQNNTCCKKFAE